VLQLATMPSEGITAPDEPLGIQERSSVDSTLIEATLALSPEERLRQNDRTLRMIQELRDGFDARRADDAAVAAGIRSR
jgi:hypothetical protein